MRNRRVGGDTKRSKQRRPMASLLLAVLCFSQIIAKHNDYPYAAKKVLNEATIFAKGIVSTGSYEFAPAFTPDGKTLYYNITSPTENFHTIVESRYVKGKWSPPQVTPFSGQYSDLNPFVTPDGSALFFSSNRPASNGAKKDFNIWMVKKTLSGWSEPYNLGAPINTDANENAPSTTSDGTLYFMANRKGGKGGLDIYRARFVNGTYTEPENLGDVINTERFELECTVSPDERFLIFAADRPGGLGGADLYISYRRNASWTPPANLGPKVNSPAWDSWARLSPDGRYLFFASTRIAGDKQAMKNKHTYQELIRKYTRAGNGFGDIYHIDLRDLNLDL
jgi:Tol biopolymer transport system component